MNAAIRVLVIRAVFLEAEVLFISAISSSDTRANEVGMLPVFLCFDEQNEDFHQRKYCAVVFQSGGRLPPFAVFLEAINDAVEG